MDEPGGDRVSSDPRAQVEPLLGGGSVRCLFCEGRHAYELELDCVVCDRPVCLLCTVRVSSSVCLCPECARERESAREREEASH